jgi:hypothetical protein
MNRIYLFLHTINVSICIILIVYFIAWNNFRGEYLIYNSCIVSSKYIKYEYDEVFIYIYNLDFNISDNIYTYYNYKDSSKNISKIGECYIVMTDYRTILSIKPFIKSYKLFSSTKNLLIIFAISLVITILNMLINRVFHKIIKCLSKIYKV